MMSKYRVLFKGKQLESVTEVDEAVTDNQLEEDHTSKTIVAFIEASSQEEAELKADRLETELQTGLTKEAILQKENATG